MLVCLARAANLEIARWNAQSHSESDSLPCTGREDSSGGSASLGCDGVFAAKVCSPPKCPLFVV